MYSYPTPYFSTPIYFLYEDVPLVHGIYPWYLHFSVLNRKFLGMSSHARIVVYTYRSRRIRKEILINARKDLGSSLKQGHGTSDPLSYLRNANLVPRVSILSSSVRERETLVWSQSRASQNLGRSK